MKLLIVMIESQIAGVFTALSVNDFGAHREWILTSSRMKVILEQHSRPESYVGSEVGPAVHSYVVSLSYFLMMPFISLGPVFQGASVTYLNASPQIIDEELVFVISILSSLHPTVDFLA